MDSKSAPRICGSELPELDSNQRMQESKSCALPLGDSPLNPAINQRNTAGLSYL